MKLKTFLQVSFCKRPTFCNNHDVLALYRVSFHWQGCQFAQIDTSPSKEICWKTEFYLLILFSKVYSRQTKLDHSELNHNFSSFIHNLKRQVYFCTMSFFVSSKLSSRAAVAGRSSQQTDWGSLCDWCLGDCLPFWPITSQD